ncbi:uncharacterized protein LOC113512262 isoform X2 [Galleria mellonella]|uniref:Uncharacterized protein LOC113512262 isoform X2 n=1 Tax=Galleria mellonella TaxID=7137 RepID=A0ABM3MUY2_GALME|nr:uncharacterized protein LOC113512262 isoform X2 [Galleria mellonella]
MAQLGSCKMAVSGDITVAQNNGQGNVKLHPYLVALVRWCVSCLWSTATVVLHRLMMRPRLRPLTALKVPPKDGPKKPRAAGTDHLHPEPKVECVVLHEPSDHKLDVIFVHGLYGSLGNTWRQGDWRPKYKIQPDIVPLIDRKLNKCECQDVQANMYEDEFNDLEFNKTFYDDIKIIPNDDIFITENFYTNSLLDQVEIVDNYEVQAEFVRDLFNKENIRNCDNVCDSKQCKYGSETGLNKGNVCTFNEVYVNEKVSCECEAQNDIKFNNCNVNEGYTDESAQCKCNKSTNDGKINDNEVDKCKNNEVEVEINGNDTCKCKINESRSCEVGCGCVCDECYSACWPKDWIKEDYPDARVISINYTSDPYLWRPLWVKESKRLRLHERAEQMLEQLLELNVGGKPIIWVGHSKGGLFIKQIYCEAYEAYLRAGKEFNSNNHTEDKVNGNETENIDLTEYNKDNELNNIKDNKNNNEIFAEHTITVREVDGINEPDPRALNTNNIKDFQNNSEKVTQQFTTAREIDGINEPDPGALNVNNIKDLENNSENVTQKFTTAREIDGINEPDPRALNVNNIKDLENNIVTVTRHIVTEREIDETSNSDPRVTNIRNRTGKKETVTSSVSGGMCNRDPILNIDEENDGVTSELDAADNDASLNNNIEGIGDVLDDSGDVRIDNRTVSSDNKDCALVLSLQERWLRATSVTRPAVRSLVETTRTLMSVLWLRIVSVHSADAGIGGLYGVSVDHREICKPSSRHCMLYKELLNLMESALNKCRCQ